MVIKIAKKENIESGRVQSFVLNEWEITIFNIKGKYCFYIRSTNIEQLNNASPKAKSQNSFSLEDGLQVVIDEDDILVLINNSFMEEDYDNSQNFETIYPN